jgi:hypothetical protein
VEVAEPEIRRLVGMLRVQLAGRAETMMEETVPMGSPATVQVLPGLFAVAVEAEHIVHRVVLTLAAPGQEVRSGLPISQHRMHPRFILKTMFKSLSIT